MTTSPFPFTPEAILPAGDDTTLAINPYTGESGTARKGIIAATLNNVVLLNNALTQEPLNRDYINALEQAVRDLIVSLNNVGVFDLFTPYEWLASDDQPGRALVALLYLQHYPHKVNALITQKLHDIRDTTSLDHVKEAIRLTLASVKDSQ